MKTIAYLRISTSQQEADSQRLAILHYAQKSDLKIDDFIEVQASSRQSTTKRRIDELIEILKEGDHLIVSELSRLGRSLGQVITILDGLMKRNIAFTAIKENIKIEGRQDIQTKVMVTLFALFAEVEQDLISQRTKEGLAKAKISGKQLGRPKGTLGKSRLDGKEGEILHLMSIGVSKASIAKITGVSRPTLYNFLKTRALAAKP